MRSAIDTLGRGGMIVLTDELGSNEGHLVFAAEAASREKLAFLCSQTAGEVRVALSPQRVDAPSVRSTCENHPNADGDKCVRSIDLRLGVSSGRPGAEQARGIAALADPGSRARGLLRLADAVVESGLAGEVVGQRRHAAAAVDLVRLAGLQPAAVLAEIANADGSDTGRGLELGSFARAHRLTRVTIADVVRHRSRGEQLVRQVGEARVPTRHGDFTCGAWRAVGDGMEHLALVRGDVRGGEPVLARVHSECLTGDVFGSRRCDCGSQLDDALAMIAEEDRGVLVYLRGHEGRGIGLGHKLNAYRLQDDGYDTVDANLQLGLPVDTRDYGIGAQILMELGVEQLRLMTNNPAKYGELDGYGFDIVARVSLPIRATDDNRGYLRTKRQRLGHLLDDLETSRD